MSSDTAPDPEAIHQLDLMGRSLARIYGWLMRDATNLAAEAAETDSRLLTTQALEVKAQAARVNEIARYVLAECTYLNRLRCQESPQPEEHPHA